MVGIFLTITPDIVNRPGLAGKLLEAKLKVGKLFGRSITQN